MNFLIRMPLGASVSLYRGERHLVGWLQKFRGGRFLAGAFVDPGLMNPTAGGNADRHGAADALVAASPDYAVHDSLWQPEDRLGPLEVVTPEVRETVRRLVEDPGSGAAPVLARRKKDLGAGRLTPRLLAHSALSNLGYTDTPDEVAERLAGTVAEAFAVFEREGASAGRRARPDLPSHARPT